MSNGWERFVGWLEENVVTSMAQIHTMMPDSLLFGSLLLYFLTQNLSYGVFAIFLFEMVLGHRMIGWMCSESVGEGTSASRSNFETRQKDVRCRAGYKIPGPQGAGRLFTHDAYPSYGMFSIASIAAYLGRGMVDWTPTLTAMKDSWASRPTVAYVLIGLFVAVFFLARLMYCDGEQVGELMVALLLGALFGCAGYALNKALFGLESMNFLGLPYMASKDEKGDTIYVCAQVQS